MKIDSNVIFGYWRNPGIDCSIEKVKSLLMEHRIDKALISSSRGIFYDDAAGNEETLSVCKNNPGLYPVGTISLCKYIDADGEIAQRKGQGFKAFRIYSEYQSIDYGGIIFRKVLKLLEKYRMPLIIRGTDQNLNSFVDRIACAASEVDIQVIVLDVSGYNLAEAIEAAKFTCNLNFGTRLFSTPQSIELFCDEAGSERLVMATGIPFYYGNQSIYRIQTARVDENVKEMIFSANLIRILGGEL